MRRRGDAWELRVYVGRDAVTGAERCATRTVHDGRRQAEWLLNEMVVAAERGSLAKTQATLGELVEAWFDHARRDFSPKTARETRGYIDRTIKPGLGSVRLARLRPGVLDQFYDGLLSPGGAKELDGPPGGPHGNIRGDASPVV